MTGSSRVCWCKNAKLEHFHDEYWRCPVCETVLLGVIDHELFKPVVDDDSHFYGKKYYQDYVVNKRGFPTIQDRARLDLPERCLHWLRTLLRYKLPPGKLLELGSAHGGFVALSQWSGYESTGLEMSPWLVEYSRTTFGINILTGPIESQGIGKSTLDVICLFDVLEHFSDPVSTMKFCADLLKPDGIFVIQTPCYPAGKSYDTLIRERQDFPLQLKPEEHVYLFSEPSVRRFFGDLGFQNVSFEQAIFSNYDMFCIACRNNLQVNANDAIINSLAQSPAGRMVLALLDADDRNPRVRL